MSASLIHTDYRPLNVPVGVEKRLGITAEEYRARQDAGEKWCTGCKGWRKIEQFDADSNQPDGRQIVCKRCRKRYNKKYQQRAIGYCPHCRHCRSKSIPSASI